jgi:hypothetical protein
VGLETVNRRLVCLGFGAMGVVMLGRCARGRTGGCFEEVLGGDWSWMRLVDLTRDGTCKFKVQQ